jgi:membrane protein YdbS with pleckstrin-like domain
MGFKIQNEAIRILLHVLFLFLCPVLLRVKPKAEHIKEKQRELVTECGLTFLLYRVVPVF